MNQWIALHRSDLVIQRDLYTTEIKSISTAWVAAAFRPKDTHTPEQKSELSLSDSLIAELQEASEYVIGVPMHNFGVPAALKLWIDQIGRFGKTFAYVDGASQGLITGKK